MMTSTKPFAFPVRKKFELGRHVKSSNFVAMLNPAAMRSLAAIALVACTGAPNSPSHCNTNSIVEMTPGHMPPAQPARA